MADLVFSYYGRKLVEECFKRKNALKCLIFRNQ